MRGCGSGQSRQHGKYRSNSEAAALPGKPAGLAAHAWGAGSLFFVFDSHALPLLLSCALTALPAPLPSATAAFLSAHVCSTQDAGLDLRPNGRLLTRQRWSVLPASGGGGGGNELVGVPVVIQVRACCR